MNIKCNPGSFIDVLRANYGRHSKTTCNPNGYAPVGNINCVSPNSFNIVDVRCSDQEKCSITADNGVFGDPCGGTLKYLDVEYQCISSNLTDFFLFIFWLTFYYHRRSYYRFNG